MNVNYVTFESNDTCINKTNSKIKKFSMKNIYLFVKVRHAS